VLVKVAAAGVNGPDLMQRKGLYPAPAGGSTSGPPGRAISTAFILSGIFGLISVGGRG